MYSTYPAGKKVQSGRAAAYACFYLHPCSEASAQIMCDIHGMKLMAARSVAMHNLATAIPALLATSLFYEPQLKVHVN